jgi:Concanavalin A-like lectin/glucanases superfamily
VFSPIRGVRRWAVAGLVFGASLLLGVGSAGSVYKPGIPPAVDPGTPTFTGSPTPVPRESVPVEASQDVLRKIHNADVEAGGAFSSDDTPNLFTRGRALYMFTHNPAPIGFAGGWAYRERPSDSNQSLYTITVGDAPLTEDTAQRRQYPSHWSSVHTATGLTVGQRKFITHDNVAVTVLTIRNTGTSPATLAVTATSPLTTTASADGTELTGTIATRYQLTTIRPRFSGDGMTVSGTSLTRAVTVAPSEAFTLKVQLGAIATELPDSSREYERYRGLDAEAAFRAHLRDYNRWWADNVPYIDVPDQNVKKMSYYRTFLNRFNLVDANVPGNDYQFPVSIEGVLGYNNAIQLTQPMHLQDLKWFRDPVYAYGNWLTSGETSKCAAFIDNPGSFSWGNTYEQYIAREGWNAYKVYGGDLPIVRNFAKYAECDVKGQLDKYDSNGNKLIEYNVGFLTGNDADTPTFHWAQFRGVPTRQDRAESAFWYSGAKAAADAYRLLGDTAKAAELDSLAEEIKQAILTRLWDDGPVDVPPPTPQPATRTTGQAGFGNAIQLNGGAPNRFVQMPAGIVSGLTDFTIATWVNRASTTGQTWARVFDFGTGTQANMFLTVNAGGAGLRFAITTNGGGAEQRITAAPQLPTGWHHVAVTKSGTTGTLWLDGAPVGTNTSLTLSPSSLGQTANNWIGRSQYADPLLNATVDDFHIYDRALTQAEIQSLLASPGGTTGGGNVAWYRFDEADGVTAVDSSGNGRDATVATPLVGPSAGHVFKHRLLANDELVAWKDQQNFTPFIEGLVPNTDDYKLALRFYADRDEYPIMPFYTANQSDKAWASANGIPGTNNFSNINSTLQGQLFARALREYPSEYITQDMYRKLLEWLTWVQYINGDNRFPDNNEFFFGWNPTTQTLGRSFIHHNILGAFNFMIVDDIAGVRPRLDDVIELWPIDVGYDRFMVNNLRYHDRDLTVVWDKPDGTRHYRQTPEGYSVYLDGRRAFTVSDLAHVTWSAATGDVQVLDGSATQVLFRTSQKLSRASDVSLVDNDRAVDMFQRAGVDLSRPGRRPTNLAVGKAVSASFTTTTPALRATDPRHAVDGFTISGLPSSGPGGQARPGYVAPNTIWGACHTGRPACGNGSASTEEWFEVDLGAPARVDGVRLYFFSDKAYNTQSTGGGNTYREPSAYTVQYFDGTSWRDVPSQTRSPATPLPNFNQVAFPVVTTQRVRVLMTRTGDYGIGLKEIQVLTGLRPRSP